MAIALRSFGVSVAGPAHRTDGRPCEDAWTGGPLAGGRFIAVADGLGSHALAAAGARAAVRAARAALRAALPAGPVGAEVLPALVHAGWRIALADVPPEQAGSTCLIAAQRPGEALWLAGLGDGLAGVRRVDGRFEALIGSRSGFGNETEALSRTHVPAAWRAQVLSALQPGDVVLLASDGIADDLLPARAGDLAAHLLRWLLACPPARRRLRMARELAGWPVPRHQDDKTLALLWAEEVA